jgi:hypothetical protein
MQVVVRQAVLLFGERYSVGLRDIPAGHCCGADWDYALKCGYVVPQESAKPAKKIETVVEEKQEKPEKKSKKLEG